MFLCAYLSLICIYLYIYRVSPIRLLSTDHGACSFVLFKNLLNTAINANAIYIIIEWWWSIREVLTFLHYIKVKKSTNILQIISIVHNKYYIPNIIPNTYSLHWTNKRLASRIGTENLWCPLMSLCGNTKRPAIHYNRNSRTNVNDEHGHEHGHKNEHEHANAKKCQLQCAGHVPTLKA